MLTCVRTDPLGAAVRRGPRRETDRRSMNLDGPHCSCRCHRDPSACDMPTLRVAADRREVGSPSDTSSVRGLAGHAVPAAEAVMHARVVVAVKAHRPRTLGYVLAETRTCWRRLRLGYGWGGKQEGSRERQQEGSQSLHQDLQVSATFCALPHDRVRRPAVR